ncbi:MAG: S49 family peptidase [Planctomycetes bacterium]|nr:S49 family peptidase [Planctomycetota bacterium]
MSDAPTPSVSDPRPTGAPFVAPPSRGASCLGVAFGVSLLFNVVAFVVLLIICMGIFVFKGGDTDPTPLIERRVTGEAKATNKVAVVEVEGVLMEGLLGYAHRQIETAAKDKTVKAIVLRVNSPGGSITASDDLYHRLVQLRDGQTPGSTGKKPLVVSMASLAASGGYYISMAGKKHIYAEETTITGSIGVFAAFPNVTGLSEKIGFDMDVIKRGEVKTGGSPFKDMTPQERAVWEDMVEEGYTRFVEVIEENRANLKGIMHKELFRKPREGIKIVKTKDGHREEEKVKFEYVRRRADGGIFTAKEAKNHGLIDEIGYLEEAITKAAELAGLGDDYKAIRYEKPRVLLDYLLGIKADQKPAALFDPGQLSSGLTPRLWYLTPQSELAGLAAALGQRP